MPWPRAIKCSPNWIFQKKVPHPTVQVYISSRSILFLITNEWLFKPFSIHYCTVKKDLIFQYTVILLFISRIMYCMLLFMKKYRVFITPINFQDYLLYFSFPFQEFVRYACICFQVYVLHASIPFQVDVLYASIHFQDYVLYASIHIQDMCCMLLFTFRIMCCMLLFTFRIMCCKLLFTFRNMCKLIFTFRIMC